MGKKIVYIHNPLGVYAVGGGIGGGINVLKLFEKTLVSRGFEVINRMNVKRYVKFVALCDFVVISGPSKEVKKIYDLARVLGKKYIFFPFYEDEQWIPYAMHFFLNASSSLQNRVFVPDNDMLLQQYQTQEFLQEMRRSVFKESLFSVVNSNQETYGVLKECSNVLLAKCKLSCGIVKEECYPNSDCFLEITGLEKGEYIMQIGRVNLRKNQIASFLGTRNLEYPIVFIFNEYSPEYMKVLIKAIETSKRKNKIYFVTSIKGERFSNDVTVIESEIDDQLLVSAYQNAGLHLHPAFYECPGYTYLEAAKLGIATVGSSWSTVREYLSNSEGEFDFHEGFEFVRPDDIDAIEAASKKMFGKTFTRPDLPIFKRTDEDVKKDMGALVDQYMC
jgi:hypothetical protein